MLECDSHGVVFGLREDDRGEAEGNDDSVSYFA